MPEGMSAALLERVRERGVVPVLVNVSEFLAKGGGSVKCMILDRGRVTAARRPCAVEFRAERSYELLFPQFADTVTRRDYRSITPSREMSSRSGSIRASASGWVRR